MVLCTFLFTNMPKHETFPPPKKYVKNNVPRLLSILRKSTVSAAPASASVSAINLCGRALENRTGVGGRVIFFSIWGAAVERVHNQGRTQQRQE